MAAHQEQLLSDPDFNPDFDHLMDVSAVTVVDAAVHEVRTLANRRVFSPTSRLAWVAKQPSVFGMFRMAAAYNEMSDAQNDLRAFYDLPSALEWLGLKGLPYGDQARTRED